MERWLTVNWNDLFVPEMSLPEILIRGTLVYVALCLLLRIILRRQAGKLSLSDLLVVALVAGVCRNPLVRDTKSIPDGLAVVTVVLFWSFALDWLSYYSPLIHRVFHPRPVLLIRDGQVLKDNLKRELMTESQLFCQLRQNGVPGPARVAEAWMEGSGQVSVIRRPARPERAPPPRGLPEEGEQSPVALAAVQSIDREIRAILEAAETLQKRWASYQGQVGEHRGALAAPAPERPETCGPTEPAGTSGCNGTGQ